jgi:uncharacterized protein involved in exopolysaccharide biosynthesis
MSTAPERTVDLGQYWRILWRRKGIVLLASITVLASAFIFLSMTRNEYQSEVTLLIEDRRPLARELEQVMGGMQPAVGRYGIEEERMAQFVGRVRSRPFLEGVIRLLRMHEDPAVRAEAESRRRDYPGVSTDEIAIHLLVASLQSRIQFARGGPGIYKIVVSDFSPEAAQTLARWIGEMFVDAKVQAELQQLRIARDFGAEQLRIYEDELRRAERALELHKGSLIQQSLTSVVVRTENLAFAEAIRQRIESEAASAQARIRALENDLVKAGLGGETAELPRDAQTEVLTHRLDASLHEVVQERLAANVAADPGADPQSVYSVARQDLMRHLEGRARTLHPNAGSDATTTLARLAFTRIDAQAQRVAADWIGEQVQLFRRRASTQPATEVERARLENEVARSQKLLDSFRAQMIASDVSQAVELTKLGLRVEILNPAQLPLEASRPQRAKILLAALLLGPVFGAGVAFLLETADPTLRSIDDFKRMFPEPILCTTPLISSLVPRQRGWRRHWVAATTAGVLILAAGFLLARQTILKDWSLSQTPVRVASPEDARPK